jgi:hypothetical protein
MSSLYPYRLVAVVPVARVAAFNTFIRNNVDPGGADWLVANLSATGIAPATHAVFDATITERAAKVILGQLATMAALVFPAGWDDLGQKAKRKWVVDNRAAIQAAVQIVLRGGLANRDTIDVAALLATLGLLRLAA